MYNAALTIALYGLYAVIAYAGLKLALVLFGLFGPIYFLGNLYLRSEIKKQGLKEYIDNATIKSMAKEVITGTINTAAIFKHNPRTQMMKDLENLALTLYLWMQTDEPFDEDSVWITHKDLIIRHNIKRMNTQ